jgi:hypothetical protein
MQYKIFEIMGYEREPGKWRASITRLDGKDVACQGTLMPRFITSADTAIEAESLQLAKGAIDEGYVT